MKNPVEIVLRGMPHSSALEHYIGEQAHKLDWAGGRILGCHVIAEALHRPTQHGLKFAVRLDITLPGTAVVVSREHGEDVYAAVRDAFKAAGLQLNDHIRRIGSAGRRSGNGTPDRGS